MNIINQTHVDKCNEKTICIFFFKEKKKLVEPLKIEILNANRLGQNFKRGAIVGL